MPDIGTLTPEQMLQQQQILRNQKMSEMLMQQGMEQPKSQMVSGHYVAPSIFQNLAGLANTFVGQRGIEKAEDAQLKLAKELREGDKAATIDYLQTKEGRPAVEGGIYGPNNQLTTQTTPDMYGANMELNPQYKQVAPVSAIPANPRAANANLAFDPRASARLQNMAFNKMMADPEGFILPEGANRVEKQPDGSFKVVASGGEKTAPDVRTAAQMLGIRGNPETWNPQQIAAVNAQVMGLKRAGATNVSVNAANKFAGGFGEKASAGAYNMYEQAIAAPQTIENAKRTIELVNSGALTGPTADVALTAAKIFNVAGANNQDTITKTEQLFSNRGKAMLGAVKGSGLAGSQGLTEGERKFLTAAEGGSITLNAETLKAMAGLEIKLAVQNQKRWNQQAGKMDKDILNATGAGPVDVYTGIGTVDQKTVDKF